MSESAIQKVCKTVFMAHGMDITMAVSVALLEFDANDLENITVYGTVACEQIEALQLDHTER